MQIEELYNLYLQHPVVTTDSRACPKGSIFFALRGETFDGNVYASKALAEGCAYAVVDRREFAAKGDPRYIAVDNALLAMQQLAALHRKKLGLPIIQITGTNGKTTTKELVSAVLAKKYNVLHTEANFNNHIGVPKTLLRLTKSHEIAVVETGANHPGEIALLTRIVDPDYGIITNVGRAHLEGFGSFEGVVKTKGELYDYLRRKPGTAIFLFLDSKVLREIATGLKAYTYGTDPDNDSDVLGSVEDCNPYLSFKWKERGDSWHEVKTKLIGDYNIANLLAAVRVGLKFNVSPEDINSALSDYVPSNNRSQLKQTENNTLIIDAYNANPTSMQAALKNFASMNAANKMVILGEMRELGAESEAEHRKIIDILEQSHIEDAWLVGESFAKLHTAFPTFPDAEAVISRLKREKISGHTILIKGSNAGKLFTIPDYL